MKKTPKNHFWNVALFTRFNLHMVDMIKLIIRILLKTKEDCRGPICSSNGIKTELVVYVLRMIDIINLTLVSVSTDVV